MPNWVYSNITITGDSDELDRFSAHIAEKPTYAQEDYLPLSFHSFITLPDESHLDEYHGMNGWKDGEHLGQTEYNWYNWNTANWYTKWDASSADVHVMSNAVGRTTSIHITFSTAWAPPDPVYVAMSEQFPTLLFGIEWEEEQGFGANLEIRGGSVTMLDTWDIPSSHADNMKRDKECVCAWGDVEDWFDDCPREGQPVFEVSAITKYIIKADTLLEAISAAQAEEGGNDAVPNTTIVSVAYSDEYVAKEKEQNNGTTEPTE